MISSVFSRPRDLVVRVSVRLFCWLWLNAACSLLVPALLVYGCLVLAFRFWADPSLLAGWILLAGLALLMGESARRAVLQLPKRAELCAFLDRCYERGGLWMAGEERDLGLWRGRLGTLAPPAIRWRGSGRLAWLLAASVYATVCWLVPQPSFFDAGVPALAVGEQVASLEDRIELEQELALIQEPEAEKYRETLAEIEADASGNEPAKTWESLDQLGKSLDEAAASGTDAALDAYRDAASVKALAQMMEQQAAGLSAQDAERAMAELAGLSGKLAREHPLLSEKLDAALNAVRNGAMTPADLAELNAALAEALTSMEDRLAELAEHRLVDPETLRNLKEARNAKALAGDLEAFLEGEQQAGANCAALMACAARAGIGRGRADAEMTWASEPTEERAKFELMPLPPTAAGEDPQNRLVGVTFTAPTAQGDASGSGGTLRSGPSVGGGSFSQSVLPRHRAAVRRFFQTAGQAERR